MPASHPRFAPERALKNVVRVWLVVALVLAFLPSLASAEGSNTPSSTSGSSRLQALARGADVLGIEPSAVYDGEALVNASGGVSRGAAYLGAFRVQLLFDADRGFGWRGASFFASVLQTHGGNPSDLVGDAQGTSNLAAPPGAQLYEAWFQQNLVSNRFSVLAGRYDLNSEFYRLQSAGLFVNSSFGTGPELGQSGQGGPSIFPNTSLGARLSLKPARGRPATRQCRARERQRGIPRAHISLPARPTPRASARSPVRAQTG